MTYYTRTALRLVDTHDVYDQVALCSFGCKSRLKGEGGCGGREEVLAGKESVLPSQRYHDTDVI